MTNKPISFDVTPADRRLLKKIVTRAGEADLAWDSMQDLTMDLEACHANGTPLQLKELLAANDMEFAHDIHGIQRHLSRTTGQLKNHFLPRFAAPDTTPVEA